MAERAPTASRRPAGSRARPLRTRRARRAPARPPPGGPSAAARPRHADPARRHGRSGRGRRHRPTAGSAPVPAPAAASSGSRWPRAGRRLHVLLIVIAMGLSLCAGRLLQLQGFDSSSYPADALTRTLPLLPARGQITDRNGLVLASTQPAVAVTADPTLTAPQAAEIAGVLSAHLGMTDHRADAAADQARHPLRLHQEEGAGADLQRAGHRAGQAQDLRRLPGERPDPHLSELPRSGPRWSASSGRTARGWPGWSSS